MSKVCPRRVFPVKNGKSALVCVTIVVTYYSKLFSTGAGRYNRVLMSLLPLVAETIKVFGRNIKEAKILKVARYVIKVTVHPSFTRLGVTRQINRIQ